MLGISETIVEDYAKLGRCQLGWFLVRSVRDAGFENVK
jgi:hypothetical protein